MYEIKVAEIIIQQNIWFIHKGLKNMRKIQIKNSPIMVCRYFYTYKNTPHHYLSLEMIYQSVT